MAFGKKNREAILLPNPAVTLGGITEEFFGVIPIK